MRKVYVISMTGVNKAVFGNIKDAYSWLVEGYIYHFKNTKIQGSVNAPVKGFNYNNLAEAFKSCRGVEVQASTGFAIANIELHYLNEQAVN